MGEGPFPTELLDATGEEIRRIGREFGATTGRPRRCGWFDVVAARHTVMTCGVDEWALTKLDVLDGFETIRICVAYELDGKRIDHFPANIREVSRCKPVYEEVPGWRTSTREVTRFGDLPDLAQRLHRPPRAGHRRARGHPVGGAPARQHPDPEPGRMSRKAETVCVPRHVAVIMDGNGRWARQRRRPRLFGHRAGAESLRAVLRACREAGVEYLTVYAFSTENWVRPENEVSGLMSLLKTFLKKDEQRTA